MAPNPELTHSKKIPASKSYLRYSVVIGLLLVLIISVFSFWLVYQAWFYPIGKNLKGSDTISSLPSEQIDVFGVNMHLVSQGIFTMGDNSHDANKECRQLSDHCNATFADEEPIHQVYLDTYYIDTYEVTNGLYKKCVNASWLGCTPPENSETYPKGIDRYSDSQFDAYPIANVTWDQARIFCAWRDARLPSEAEWEKAARGIDGRIYPWGNTFDGAKTNFCDKNCQGGASNPNYDDGYADVSPVNSFPQGISPYGVYNLAGNVDEWTSDWYDENYYQNSPASNPHGPSWGLYRTKRGGSWWYSGNLVRSTARGWSSPGTSSDLIGFRCARSAR